MFKNALYAFFVATLMLGTSSLWAGACDSDMEQYCSDVQPGAGALANCIQKNMPNFSAQCREQITKISSAAKRIGNACINDARTYCRDSRPGFGRVKDCMLANRDKLSSDCQAAITAAGF